MCENIAIDEKGKCYLLSKKDSKNVQSEMTKLSGIKQLKSPSLSELKNSIGPYSVTDENAQRRRISLVTPNMMTLVRSCPFYKINTDVTFKARRDDSSSSTTFIYYRLDKKKEEKYVFKGGYSDVTIVSFDGTHLICSGDQCQGLPNNQPVPVIVLAVDFNPRDGSAHGGLWWRNQYSISGSYIQVVCTNK